MKKQLRISAYSGIIFIVWVVLSLVLSLFIKNITFRIFDMLITSVTGVIFTYGFIIFGKKYNSSFLKIMAWIGILFSIGFLLYSLGSYIFYSSPITELINNINGSSSIQDIEPIFYTLIKFYILVSLFAGLYSILFGISLLKIKKNIKYARITGILNIIAGATYIIFLGFIIHFIAKIYEIILLFKESKK